MIKFRRFSGAMFAAALLFCAFPVPTGGQDKNAPSNAEKNPPNVVLEDHFEKLQANFLKLQIDFLKTKQELAQKIDTINRRLDSINKLQSVRGEQSGNHLSRHRYRCCLTVDLIIVIYDRVQAHHYHLLWICLSSRTMLQRRLSSR